MSLAVQKQNSFDLCTEEVAYVLGSLIYQLSINLVVKTMNELNLMNLVMCLDIWGVWVRDWIRH